VLYQIDPSSYQAAVDQTKADLANTQAMVVSSRLKDERYKELIEIQGVSKQDADDAHASYLQAPSQVDERGYRGCARCLFSIRDAHGKRWPRELIPFDPLQGTYGVVGGPKH
jgi:hypothetical protein